MSSRGTLCIGPTSQYTNGASANSAMFLVSCVVHSGSHQTRFEHAKPRHQKTEADRSGKDSWLKIEKQ